MPPTVSGGSSALADALGDLADSARDSGGDFPQVSGTGTTQSQDTDTSAHAKKAPTKLTTTHHPVRQLGEIPQGRLRSAGGDGERGHFEVELGESPGDIGGRVASSFCGTGSSRDLRNAQNYQAHMSKPPFSKGTRMLHSHAPALPRPGKTTKQQGAQ